MKKYWQQIEHIATKMVNVYGQKIQKHETSISRKRKLSENDACSGYPAQKKQKIVSKAKPIMTYITVQKGGRTDDYFAIHKENPKTFRHKVAIITNQLIDEGLRLELIEAIKPLQAKTNNSRSGDDKIQYLIDPTLTAGHNNVIPAEYNPKRGIFTSNINQVSRYEYGHTIYPLIGKIFKCMLPLFEWVVGRIDRCLLHTRPTLQIIVKMQDYQLQDGDKYEGTFHSEGLNKENIIAVGIYYFDIDSSINGGD